MTGNWGTKYVIIQPDWVIDEMLELCERAKDHDINGGVAEGIARAIHWLTDPAVGDPIDAEKLERLIRQKQRAKRKK